MQKECAIGPRMGANARTIMTRRKGRRTGKRNNIHTSCGPLQHFSHGCARGGSKGDREAMPLLLVWSPESSQMRFLLSVVGDLR